MKDRVAVRVTDPEPAIRLALAGTERGTRGTGDPSRPHRRRHARARGRDHRRVAALRLLRPLAGTGRTDPEPRAPPRAPRGGVLRRRVATWRADRRAAPVRTRRRRPRARARDLHPEDPRERGPQEAAVLVRDGAICEALAKVDGDSRADFLRKATVGGAALVGALAAAPAASAQSKSDVDILNYALTLEYVQAAFYTEAEEARALRGKAARAAAVVGPVERAHVRAFRKALGST